LVKSYNHLPPVEEYKKLNHPQELPVSPDLIYTKETFLCCEEGSSSALELERSVKSVNPCRKFQPSMLGVFFLFASGLQIFLLLCPEWVISIVLFKRTRTGASVSCNMLDIP